MFRFQWSKEGLNYLKDNQGLINELELAFAEFRGRGTRTPEQGVVDQIAPLQYIWGIHEYIVLFHLVPEDSGWKIRVGVIKPVRSVYDEILFGE
ncbi:hypothetical protein KFU94_01480 [Chloroflexi bacterium TSY]|nr:hypothetical protein [Chloroflexi bacterium TSY]